MAGARVNPYEEAESIAAKRTGPGILMLSTSLQLLYSDRQSWELCAKINQAYGGKTANGVLPTAIVDFCSEIVQMLQVRTEAKDWEEFRIKRVLGHPKRPVLLCGFGLPDPGGFKHSRILITMEEIGRQQETLIEQAKEMYRLTDREVQVVRYLLKGWTNKEIGNALHVTEQTIKEHIKHVMTKTKTTTRTGILIQVLRL